MNERHPKVDAFLDKAKKWRPEMERLRAILLESPLTEEFKWNKPCYTYDGGNVVILAGLKEHCWLAFFKGALLRDPKAILVKAGDNTRAGRVIKFTSVQQIATMEPVLKAFVQDAIEVEKAGLKVDFKTNSEPILPEELRDKFDEMPELKSAFEALTPGRQRGYGLYFSAATQFRTRVARIEKNIPRILEGKGIHDR